MKATRDNTTYDGFNGVRPVYTTDASELGLAPGEWPGQIDTELGNGQPLLRKDWHKAPDGTLLDVIYWQAFGIVELRVFNT